MKKFLIILAVLFGWFETALVFPNEYSSIEKYPQGGSYGIGNSGGFFYLNEEGRVFYYDLDAKKAVDFTSVNPYFQKLSVKPTEFAASRSGETFVCKQDSKVYSVDLPNGAPRTFQIEIWGPVKKNTDRRSDSVALECKDILWQKPISNIAISPNESKIVFESAHNGMAWSLYSPINPPVYALRPASCNAIFSLSSNYNHYDAPIRDPFSPRYGNVAEWPPVSLFQYKNENFNSMATTAGESGDPEGRIYTRRALTKNARFATFMKNGLMAFAYQLENGQWKVEIRAVDSPIFGADHEDDPDVVTGKETCNLLAREFERLYPGFPRDGSYGASNCPIVSAKNFEKLNPKFKKPRHWEFQFSLPNCEGLALIPDDSSIGSLAIQCQGKLGYVAGKDIEKGISESGIKQEVHGSGSVKEIFIRPTNNILKAKINLLGMDIVGSSLTWVSEKDYLILGKDRCVYRCNKEGRTKLLGPISSPFYYCEKSPLKSSHAATSGKGEFVFKHPNELNSQIGSIKLGYIVANTVGYSLLTTGKGEEIKEYHGPVNYFVGKIGNQPPLEYCVTGETDFEKVKEYLSSYKFKYNYMLDTFHKGDSPSDTKKILVVADSRQPNQVTVPDNIILLLRSDTRLVGLRHKKIAGTESSYSYEWQSFDGQNYPNQKTPSLALAEKKTAKETNKEIEEPPASDDKEVSSLKVGLLRKFSFPGIKFNWAQGQGDEIVLVVNYVFKGKRPENFKSLVLEGKGISDIGDPSAYRCKRGSTLVGKSNKANTSIVLKKGDTVLMKYNDLSLALRPMSIDGKVVTYKQKLFQSELASNN